ncbi:MAG: hypothetical protein AAF525_19175 [Pseudomonadota bacterium]
MFRPLVRNKANLARVFFEVVVKRFALLFPSQELEEGGGQVGDAIGMAVEFFEFTEFADAIGKVLEEVSPKVEPFESLQLSDVAGKSSDLIEVEA